MKKLIALPVLMMFAFCRNNSPETTPNYSIRYSMWILDTGMYDQEDVRYLIKIFESDTTLRYAALDSCFAYTEGNTLHHETEDSVNLITGELRGIARCFDDYIEEMHRMYWYLYLQGYYIVRLEYIYALKYLKDIIPCPTATHSK